MLDIFWTDENLRRAKMITMVMTMECGVKLHQLASKSFVIHHMLIQ